MAAKDYFSGQSALYAAFRPTYPEALYSFIFSHLMERGHAWDCGTGNGQVALHLATHFRRVEATDISREQLAHAKSHPSIRYHACPAEQTPFAENTFDLVTVAQALHWFDTTLFYNEVRRTARPGALLAVWGYSFLSISAEIDRLFLHFYHDVVGRYWDEARRHVETQYRDVPFPFEEISAPAFSLALHWNRDHFSGYLASWSATREYIRVNGVDPVPALMDSIAHVWKENEVKPVTFPLFVKLGRI